MSEEVRAGFLQDDRSPGAARNFARDALGGWGFKLDVIDTAELLVSEVVTNAVRHARTSVELVIARHGDCVRFEAWDDGDGSPVVIHADSLDESGRGVWLVEALSAEWGFLFKGRRKGVWFELKP
jgi:anti-sigma regulatory factor (Ser/Thr protein kinase)